MNKTDLIEKVAEKSDLTKKDSEKAVNALLDTIVGALQSGDNVQVIGFGNFETRKRGARTGRNPQTGEEITIAESLVPTFKPGAKLKEAVK